ncbi:putative quinol monooxygenase [Peribacillus sp. SCS-155]|uniref:putative quinol monooxygenase n=1 Tax=Peribacillus sedimenti TaxID=3115297 RepID=UPI003905A05B
MNHFGLFGKFITKEGERDALVDILLRAAQSMQDLEDCEIYTVHVSPEESNSVFVYEVWKDESAHQASLLLEATQELIQSAKPLIAGMERICTIKPIGGKGLTTPS